MSLSSIFGQLLQSAFSYDRYTPGDELRLDYKSDQPVLEKICRGIGVTVLFGFFYGSFFSKGRASFWMRRGE